MRRKPLSRHNGYLSGKPRLANGAFYFLASSAAKTASSSLDKRVRVRLISAQQLGQLGDVRGYALRLAAGQQFGPAVRD
jgi:hypothetical protein